MSLDDFLLGSNNQSKEQLNKNLYNVRKEQIAKKLHNLFDAFDVNKSGTLEKEELSGLESWIRGLAQIDGNDKNLSEVESILGASVFKKQFNLNPNEKVDFLGFAKAVSDASSEVIAINDTIMGYPAEPGFKPNERLIKTYYKDGVVEEIALYANGDLKYKKTTIPHEREYSNGNFTEVGMSFYGSKYREYEYKEEYSNKYLKEQEGRKIAANLHNYIENNNGALNDETIVSTIENITPKNIVEVLNAYDEFLFDENLIELILGEFGNNDEEMQAVLTGENGIFTSLLAKAQDVGMSSESLASFKTEIEETLNKSLSQALPNSARLNGILLALKNNIELYETNPEFKNYANSEYSYQKYEYNINQGKLTLNYILPQISAARRQLEAHYENLKENPIKNLGEIILEDFRFWKNIFAFGGLPENISDKFSKLTGFEDKNIIEDTLGIDTTFIEALGKSIHEKINELKELEYKLRKINAHDTNFEEEYKNILGVEFMPDSINGLLNLVENAPWKDDPKYIQYLKDMHEYTSKITAQYTGLMGNEKLLTQPFDLNKYLEIAKDDPNKPKYDIDTNSKEYQQYTKQIEDMMTSILGKNYNKNIKKYIETSGVYGGLIEIGLFIAATIGTGTFAADAGWLTRAAAGAKTFGSYSVARGSLNFIDDALKLTGASDAIGWTDTHSFEDILGDRQNITFGGILIGENNAANFKKALAIIKNWADGNISTDIAKAAFKEIDGFSFDDFVTSTGGQLVINTATSAIFGATMGITAPYVAKVGEWGAKLGEKMGMKAPELTKVGLEILSKHPEGLSGAEFLTQVAMKMQSQNAAAIGAKFIAETAVFFTTNLSISVIQEVLSESNTDLEDAWAKGPDEFAKYLATRFGQEAINLLEVKSIGMIIAMMMGMNQQAVIRDNYSQYQTMKNVTIRIEDIATATNPTSTSATSSSLPTLTNIPEGKCITVTGPTGKLVVDGNISRFFDSNGKLLNKQNIGNSGYQNADAVTKTIFLLHTYTGLEAKFAPNTSANPVQDAEFVYPTENITNAVEKAVLPNGNNSTYSKLEAANSRAEFVAIRNTIKAMPEGPEKTALQEAYFRKWNEFAKISSEKFDIKMEYKQELEISKNSEASEKEFDYQKEEEKLRNILKENNYISENDLDYKKIINTLLEIAQKHQDIPSEYIYNLTNNSKNKIQIWDDKIFTDDITKIIELSQNLKKEHQLELLEVYADEAFMYTLWEPERMLFDHNFNRLANLIGVRQTLQYLNTRTLEPEVLNNTDLFFEIMYGEKSEELKNLEKEIKEKDNINLHVAANLTKERIYDLYLDAKKTLDILEKAGYPKMTDIYICENSKLVNYNHPIDISLDNPSEMHICSNVSFYEIANILKTVVMTQGIKQRNLPLADKPLGTEFEFQNGKLTEKHNHDLKKWIQELSPQVGIYDKLKTTEDFILAYEKAFMNGKIRIEATEVNGITLHQKYIAKDAYFSNDSERKKLAAIIEHFFAIGGKAHVSEPNQHTITTLNELMNLAEELKTPIEKITDNSGNTLIMFTSYNKTTSTQHNIFEFDKNGNLIKTKTNVENEDINKEFPSYNYKTIKYEDIKEKYIQYIEKSLKRHIAGYELGEIETLKIKNITSEQAEYLDLCLNNDVCYNASYSTDNFISINKENISLVRKLFEIPAQYTKDEIQYVHFKQDLEKDLNIILNYLKTKEEIDFAITLIEKGLMHRTSTCIKQQEFNAFGIEKAIQEYRKNPEIASQLVSLGFKPNNINIDILNKYKDLPIEKIKTILELSQIKELTYNTVLDIDRLNEEYEAYIQSDKRDIGKFSYLNYIINEITPEEVATIKKYTLIQENFDKETLETLANIKAESPETYKNVIQLFDDELQISPNILKNFANLEKDVQKEFLSLIKENKELLAKYKIEIDNISENAVKNLKTIDKYEDIFAMCYQSTINELIVIIDANTNLINQICQEIKKDPQLLDIVKNHESVTKYIFGLKLNNINEGIYHDYINALKNAKNYTFKDKTTLIKIINKTLDSILVKRLTPSIEKGLNTIENLGLKDLTEDDIITLITTPAENLTKNNEILNKILSENKEDILKEITLKCKNLCPYFTERVESILNDKSHFAKLLVLPNLSKDIFINELYAVAKMTSAVYKKPQDYLNGQFDPRILEIVIKHRTKENENKDLQKINEIEEFEGASPIEKIRLQEQLENIDIQLKHKFEEKILDILHATIVTDPETVKLLLDMRFNDFNYELERILPLSENSKKKLHTFITKGKRINKKGEPAKLAGHEKLDLINIFNIIERIKSNYNTDFDIAKYKIPINEDEFIIDFTNLRKDLFKLILINYYDINEAEIANLKPENMNWDFSKISLFAGNVTDDAGELAILLKEACKGNFKEYINDPTNPYGESNQRTKEEFAQYKLNYDGYQTGPEAQTITIMGKDYSIKLWNRIPQESIHDGKYTTCCTALDGCNGGAMANYMLNTAINVVEIKNAKGDVVAMSRCYIGIVDDKPTMIVENIEVNSKFNQEMASANVCEDLINGIFKYFEDYTKLIYPEGMPIYLSTSYQHITFDMYKKFQTTTKNIKFVGDITKDKLYLNTFKENVDAKNLPTNAELYIVKEEDKK